MGNDLGPFKSAHPLKNPLIFLNDTFNLLFKNQNLDLFQIWWHEPCKLWDCECMGSYSPESKPKQKINRLFSPIDQTSPGKPTFFEVEKLLICAHYARSLLFGGLILYRKSNICPKILTKREQFFFLSFFFFESKSCGFKFQCKHPFLSYAPKVVFM